MERSSAETVRKEIAGIANRLLSGELGLHEGCRAIAHLRTRLPDADLYDPDVLVFVVVDSDLDDVPLGVARQRWDPAALATKDQRATEYLGQVREKILRACQTLSLRWGASA
ncbi:MAG TPA: hypothetical protein VIG99_33295 [Myxococcaceae bacterium]